MVAKAVQRTQLSDAQRYGPGYAQATAKSKYLEDAIRGIQVSGQNIQSAPELGTKLLAQAVAQWGKGRSDELAAKELQTAKSAQNAALLSVLDTMGADQTAPPAVQQAAAPAPVAAQVAPAATAPQITPDIDALVRTIYGEARGEPAEGQQAVANVILNRAGGRGMSVPDVVRQKGQFEPWGNPQTRAVLEALSQDDPAYQAILKNIAPALQGQDITGGADHFYSPGAQSALGRQAPSWDNGKGRDLGRHRFFDLEPGQGAPLSPQAQPFEVATAGEMQPGMIPGSAPAAIPAGGGQAPAAGLPPAAGAPDPRARQINMIRSLLSNPQTADMGQQLVMDMITREGDAPEFGFINAGNGTVVRTDPRTGQAVEAYKGADGGGEFGLSLVYSKDAQGNLHAYQPNKAGGVREVVLPGGQAFAPGLTSVDTGMGTVILDNKGGGVVGNVEKDVRGAAAAGAQGRREGENDADAVSSLSKVEAAATDALSVIDQVLEDPELVGRTGLSGMIPALPGSPGLSFDLKDEQLRGKAFLAAYEQLRGAGAITEGEGRAATSAMARINRKQSAADYKAAVQELRGVIKRGVELARTKAARAGGQGGGQGAPAGAAPRRGVFNPATGKVEWR